MPLLCRRLSPKRCRFGFHFRRPRQIDFGQESGKTEKSPTCIFSSAWPISSCICCGVRLSINSRASASRLVMVSAFRYEKWNNPQSTRFDALRIIVIGSKQRFAPSMSVAAMSPMFSQFLAIASELSSTRSWSRRMCGSSAMNREASTSVAMLGGAII